MQANGTIAILGVAGIGIAAFARLHKLFKSAGQNQPVVPEPAAESAEFIPGGEPMSEKVELSEQRVTYARLSQLWRDGEVRKVKFDDLSKIWRPEQEKVEEKKREVNFTRPFVAKFYVEYIRGKGFFQGPTHDAVLDILELLDAEGHCGSVVRQNEKEPEKIYDVDTYNTLARVPLYRHSINVAVAAMNMVTTPSIAPKAVIAALAHDLGKLPRFYGKYYKTINHPMVGFNVAEMMPNVKGIKWWDEIASAIKNHHGQSSEYLDSLIREADQAARRLEMNQAEDQTDPDLLPETEAVGVPTPARTPTPEPAPPAEKEPLPDRFVPRTQPKSAPPAVQPAAARSEEPEAQATATGPAEAPELPPETNTVQTKGPAFIMPSATVEPEQQERKRVPRQRKDISAWFEPEKFVKELGKIINTTQTGDKFWSALALGPYVYVKPVGFYGLVVRHSKHDPAVVTAGASEQDRDDYLYSVVMELKKLKDMVATEFLSGDRFGAVFIHNPGPDGAGSKQFLIPFRSNYFGDEITRAETRRNTLMKKTTELVPAFNKGGN